MGKNQVLLPLTYHVSEVTISPHFIEMFNKYTSTEVLVSAGKTIPKSSHVLGEISSPTPLSSHFTIRMQLGSGKLNLRLCNARSAHLTACRGQTQFTYPTELPVYTSALPSIHQNKKTIEEIVNTVWDLWSTPREIQPMKMLAFFGGESLSPSEPPPSPHLPCNRFSFTVSLLKVLFL